MTSGSRPPSPWPRSRWLAPLALAVLVVLPYHRLARFEALVITDDVFASDLANWEFPVRAALGEQLRDGDSAAWLPGACLGYPALAGTGATEPLSLALFRFLPPAVAIDTLLLALLLLAAFGAYAYARKLGASRSGALLAGLSYAFSGYLVCQLRRVGAATVAAYLPWGLLALEHVLRSAGRRRWLAAAALAAVFGLQVLAGFPQTAFYAALAYAGMAVMRALWSLLREGRGAWRRAVAGGLLVGLALLLGAGLGAPSLFAMRELAGISDRVGGLGWQEITKIRYWSPNLLTFLRPYAHGDASDLSYGGPSLFWEDYGYFGLLPFLLSLGALWARRREGPALALGILAALGLLYVLGPATPLFRWSFEHLPGIDLFRLPTRMLVVVTAALTALAALGLTSLERRAGRRGRLLGLALVTVTYGDLVTHQMRQNAFVEADRWLEPPATVARLEPSLEPPGRVASLGAGQAHIETFMRAGGWAGDLEPYVELRELLQPNLQLHWGVSSVGCYMSLLPRWTVDVIGDRGRRGLLDHLYRMEPDRLVADPRLARLLRLLGTEFVVTPRPLEGEGFEAVGACEGACVYRLERAQGRTWVARHAVLTPGAAGIDRLLGAAFDPKGEVLLDADPRTLPRPRYGAPPGRAEIVEERSDTLRLEVDAPGGGYLVLADGFYPGWQAEVDGRRVPLYRANLTTRAIALPRGRHEVRFAYRPEAALRGLRVSAAAALVLLATLWLARRRRT